MSPEMQAYSTALNKVKSYSLSMGEAYIYEDEVWDGFFSRWLAAKQCYDKLSVEERAQSN